MYSGYITELKSVRQHPNADRLQIATCFGNTVVVGLDCVENQKGVYFPVDGKLGYEYAVENNLLRKKAEDGSNIGGYLDPDKRNIRAIMLRKEKSDGLFMPLTSLSKFCNIDELQVGQMITELNGVVICEKYIPRRNRGASNNGNTGNIKKQKTVISPLFTEHKDTEQLAYNLHSFKEGDILEFSLKMHGTSQRTGHLPILKGYKKTIFDRLFGKIGKPIYDWGYVTGTRRVVLGDTKDINGGFYGSNKFRIEHAKLFEGKLAKGETVYYEVVGYTDYGTPIMSSCSNKKDSLGKDFIKENGEETVFSYGCALGESKVFVYRMTMTNQDGFVVEYSPTLVRTRCDQMGVEAVPVLCTYTYCQTSPDFLYDFKESQLKNLDENPILTIANYYAKGRDPVGKSHIREGVVVRVVNAPTFKAYKHKSFEFKVIEGIIKDSALEPDREELEDNYI